MAARGRVEINPEHLEGGDGTLIAGLQMWSARNRPLKFTAWQSLYWSLRREHFAKDASMEGWSPSQHAAQIRSTYEGIQLECHGPDFRAQALIADPVPFLAPVEHVPAALVEEPAEDASVSSRQGQGRVAARDLPTISQPPAEEYQIATPRGVRRLPTAFSPDYLMHQTGTREILDRDPADHTEMTDEQEERHER